MKEVLVKNGVEEEKIFILPNAVDSEKFKFSEPDESLKRELGIEDKTVIGYVGSLLSTKDWTYCLRHVLC